MSVFEDYNTTCASYDNQRQPLGADLVVEMLRLNIGKQLKVSNKQRNNLQMIDLNIMLLFLCKSE
jgi:hypothetical protein